MPTNASPSPGRFLPSNTLLHDTYSVTLDTRKAWGSREAASTLQGKAEVFKARSRGPSRGCPALLENLRSQLPRAGRAVRSPALGQLLQEIPEPPPSPTALAWLHFMQNGCKQQLPSPQPPRPPPFGPV